ncbi:MAG: hypothetical protein KF819_12145 [Labilithrix sp.]|nr:hypothetical protein [Labilithrix sp.]
MSRLALFLACSLACSCVLSACSSGEPGQEASSDAEVITESSVASWAIAQTLHVGEVIEDHLAAPSPREPHVRVVHPFFVRASREEPVTLHFDLEGENPVQAAVLAPIHEGARATVRAEGYATASKSLSFDVVLERTGVHLLAVATHRFEAANTIRVSSSAASARGAEGAVVAPVSGSLAGRTIAVELSRALGDEEIELWASPPPYAPGERRKVASARSAGGRATFRVSADVAEGDDLLVVVPAKAPGTSIPLESGVPVRLWTKSTPGIRFDRVGIGDLGNLLTFTGVLPFFEGRATLALYSASRTEGGRPLHIGGAVVERDRPGQAGMGLARFDAEVTLPLFVDEDELNPRLPRTGEILAVGVVTEKPSFAAVGCFRFCNDLSGQVSCEAAPVPCPAGVASFDR